MVFIRESTLVEKGVHYEICHIETPIPYDIVLRRCPFCDRILLQNDFFGDDKHWNNLKLSIPCCECYNIMMYCREGIEYNILKKGLRWIIEFRMEVCGIKMAIYSTILTKEILGKFISLGFIDERKVIENSG